ncbi:glutaredoxin family protein [Corallococcus sp. H22C18031201]|uniref:glutaredoxin family protein n=1 Tax=Citreicoccus inhibens TaxID=2849499 RepID=UPI000E742E5D|nr:glutaredoxin family protein [Citreicoccus inhibens]MBU8900615.1 glutaredoxin family protein [Citreicoccus inhibens]RJS16322.1 glutaredoxin family protein [Corallococcus sp. H22C18031201]
MRVDIYSKPNCSLCEKARVVVEEVRARIPFELRILSILEDPELLTRWRYEIPVVVIDGVPAFTLHVDAVALEARVREALGGTPVAKTLARDG